MSETLSDRKFGLAQVVPSVWGIIVLTGIGFVLAFVASNVPHRWFTSGS